MLEVRSEEWRHRCAASSLRDRIAFDGDDLVLGHGTILCKLGATRSDTISLRSDPEYDRMVALLVVASEGRLAESALAQVTVAVKDWQSGDRALAAIRLALARLPRLRDERDAYRLFLAEMVLDAGLSPIKLIKELSYESCVALFKFDPNQPRVPAGTGVESGRWTSGSADGAGGSGHTSATKPIPVFMPSEPDEADVPTIEKTDRYFGLPDFDTHRSGQRLHVETPLGMPVSPAAPTRAPLTAPATGPGPAPLPGGVGGAGSTQSDSDGRSACPEPQDDRPRGRNPSGDEHEYAMSLLINPNDPTPKYSAAAPNVTSQAYYPPSPTSDGKSAFDDCKKDDTPTILNIPNLKPGDMFEMKSLGWSGLLSNENTNGYQSMKSQVENQSAAVVADGRGRQIYFCMGDQSASGLATKAFGKYPNSHFLVCH